jgi:UDP-2-acetamido-3-amino-2,3-dideoxy-glucuronate N-acetyltransferase
VSQVGRYAFIGAGSLVKADVRDYALVVGVPAKQIGWVCECGVRLDNQLSCPSCKTKFISSDNCIIKKIS